MATVFPQDIECIIDPISGKGGIYISNVEAAQNPVTLASLGICAIITCAKGQILLHPASVVPYYKYIPADDSESFDLSRYFSDCSQFIDGCLHCLAGVSRSVTLVLAYLMKKQGLSLIEAFRVVKARRDKIYPNNGFLQQLKQWEKGLTAKKEGAARPQSNNHKERLLTEGSKEEYKANKQNISLNTFKVGYHSKKMSSPNITSRQKDVDYDKKLWTEIQKLNIKSNLEPSKKILRNQSCKFQEYKQQLSSITKEIFHLRDRLKRPPSSLLLSKTSGAFRPALRTYKLN